MNNEHGKTVRVGVIAALISATALTGVPAGQAGAAPDCAPYVIVGVPGSNEGVSFHPGSSAPEDLYGPEVWQATKEVNVRLGERAAGTASSTQVDYPAILDANPATPALNYNGSEYKQSKNTGYTNAYNTVAQVMSTCSTSKLIVIGYSQGAHIAGDVAQTITHSSQPIARDRLAGVLLLADPAFNIKSPGTWTLDYAGSNPGTIELTNQWREDESHGSLGSRAAFDADDNVVSVCINQDAVCETTVANIADSQFANTVHSSYRSAQVAGTGKTLATWSADLLVDTMLQ